MKRIIVSLLSAFVFVPQSVFAQNEIEQTIYNQLKEKIEVSCTNSEYLSCVDISTEICNQVSDNELEKISTILESNSQAIAQGDFTQLLKEIKTSRISVLEEKGIEVEKANACGKEFLRS